VYQQILPISIQTIFTVSKELIERYYLVEFRRKKEV